MMRSEKNSPYLQIKLICFTSHRRQKCCAKNSERTRNAEEKTGWFWLRQFFRGKSLLPVIRRRVAGVPINFLLDTGATKNFIRPRKGLKGIRPVDSPFEIHSFHGATTITKKKCFVSIFNLKATFFILPDFTIFAADLLTQAGSSLCLASAQLKWGKEVEKISFHKCTNVNFTNVECSDAPPLVKKAFLGMIKSRKTPSQIPTKHCHITHR